MPKEDPKKSIIESKENATETKESAEEDSSSKSELVEEIIPKRVAQKRTRTISQAPIEPINENEASEKVPVKRGRKAKVTDEKPKESVVETKENVTEPKETDKNDEPSTSQPVEEKKPKRAAQKRTVRRGRKVKVTDEDPKENNVEAEENVIETNEIDENDRPSISEPVQEKKPKRMTSRTKSKLQEPVEEAKTTQEIPVKAVRSMRKNTATIDTPDDSNDHQTSQPKKDEEKKPTRGRTRKNTKTEDNVVPEQADSSDVPSEPVTKKRAVRGRAASKSENIVKEESTKQTVESAKEPPKTRGKRTRKAEDETVENENEDQPSIKRTRSNKKINTEPEEEPKQKETVAEKKTRQTKKVTESNDTESTSAASISTRTRRRK